MVTVFFLWNCNVLNSYSYIWQMRHFISVIKIRYVILNCGISVRDVLTVCGRRNINCFYEWSFVCARQVAAHSCTQGAAHSCTQRAAHSCTQGAAHSCTKLGAACSWPQMEIRVEMSPRFCYSIII